MKIILPDGTKRYLKQTDAIEVKLRISEEITTQWEWYFIENWESNKVKMCLSVLADYLVRGNMQGKHDKEVLSEKRDRDMKFSRKCIPFSELSRSQQRMLGLVDIEDTDE